MPAVTPDIPKTEIAIVEMTNAFRQENKLAAVQLNATLTRAAREYAQFLASTELFSHEADGRRPADRARAAGYQFCEIAENLAAFVDSRGFETRDLARQMVEGWKNSLSHRKAMLAPGVTELGVAVVKVKGVEKYLSVQLFGRPASLQFSFEIENNTNNTIRYTFELEKLEVKPRFTVRHTACSPGEISFDISGGIFARAVGSRYETRDGRVFRLITDVDGKVRIELIPSVAQ
jgi:hypothetical protein